MPRLGGHCPQLASAPPLPGGGIWLCTLTGARRHWRAPTSTEFLTAALSLWLHVPKLHVIQREREVTCPGPHEA